MVAGGERTTVLSPCRYDPHDHQVVVAARRLDETTDCRGAVVRPGDTWWCRSVSVVLSPIGERGVVSNLWDAGQVGHLFSMEGEGNEASLHHVEQYMKLDGIGAHSPAVGDLVLADRYQSIPPTLWKVVDNPGMELVLCSLDGAARQAIAPVQKAVVVSVPNVSGLSEGR